MFSDLSTYTVHFSAARGQIYFGFEVDDKQLRFAIEQSWPSAMGHFQHGLASHCLRLGTQRWEIADKLSDNPPTD
jgi:hypothetical protein